MVVMVSNTVSVRYTCNFRGFNVGHGFRVGRTKTLRWGKGVFSELWVLRLPRPPRRSQARLGYDNLKGGSLGGPRKSSEGVMNF